MLYRKWWGAHLLPMAVLLLFPLACSSKGRLPKPAGDGASHPVTSGNTVQAAKDEGSALPTQSEHFAIASPQPPDGQWLTDDQGRSYFLDRLPRKHGVRIDKKTVRTVWGFSVEVAKEDDEYYYVKVYKVEPLPPPAESSEVSVEEQRKIQATYQAEVTESDRLRFVPFNEGLPTAGQWREGFTLADMNEDGYLDIVHGPARKSLGPPVVFLGDGKGKWTRWREAQYPPLAYDYGDAQVGDFNNDGHRDLALGVHLRGLIVLLGDGRGHFTLARQGSGFIPDGKDDKGARFSSLAIKVVDWNADGRADILALGEGPRPNFRAAGPGASSGASSQGPVVYLNQGNGEWKRHAQGTGSKAIFGTSLTLGDFNGDTRIDFATASSMQGRKDLVNIGLPTGEWKPLAVSEVRPNALVRAVVAGDVDRDRRDDLIVAYLSYELNTWHTGIDVLYARPEGTWQRRALFAEEGTRGVVALAVGDVDADHHLDLVALTGSGDTWVFLGDGSGFFTKERTGIPRFAGGCSGSHVELADLDGDGRDEIVTAFAQEATDESPATLGQSGAADPALSPCPSEGGLSAWKATVRP